MWSVDYEEITVAALLDAGEFTDSKERTLGELLRRRKRKRAL
jgi:hypothetical protein